MDKGNCSLGTGIAWAGLFALFAVLAWAVFR